MSSDLRYQIIKRGLHFSLCGSWIHVVRDDGFEVLAYDTVHEMNEMEFLAEVDDLIERDDLVIANLA